jgi:hypothetical protein
MGTTDNFDVPDATDFGLTDQVPIKDASTSRGGYATGGYMLSGLAAAVAVTAGATTLAVTQATHGNRVVTLANTAPIAVTLPQATGTGAKYTFQLQQAATGTASTIKVANATDVMQGVSWCLTTSSAAVVGYGTTATDDTISLNGTTKGGVAGDIIEITDVKTGFFSVKMFSSPTGTTATPFSATV